MIPLSNVNWGPIDATVADDKFSAKWIEPPQIRSCLDHNRWIVTGEKGSGKSAIERAMREVHSSEYYVTPLVNFDKVNFELLYKNLTDISRTTSLDAGIALSKYWQYSMVVELIKACVGKDPSLYSDLLDGDPVKHHHHMSLSERFMSLLQEAWNKLDDFTSSPKTDPRKSRANILSSGGVDADFLHSLGEFPLGKSYEQIRDDFFQRIERNRHRATLILDGFDTLMENIVGDKQAPSIHLVFSSLVDAIMSLRTNGKVPSFIGIKALIPHDRFMNIKLRDLDKVDAMRMSIRWNPETLKIFVEKRILLTPGIRQGQFPALWTQIMPEFVFNRTHAIYEDSFEYILRHTMLRPRQVQIHLDTLARAYPDQNISPTMIPNSIAESSKNLAQYFFAEYKIDHPHLEDLILGFDRKPSVMPFGEFRNHVAAYIRKHGFERKAEEEIDELYVMGVFGVVKFLEIGEAKGDRYYPPTKDARQHYLDFFFRAPHKNISLRLQDDALVALHPMFVDFATLRPYSMIIG